MTKDQTLERLKEEAREVFNNFCFEDIFNDGGAKEFDKRVDQIIEKTWQAFKQAVLDGVPEERVSMLNTGEKQLRYDDGHNSCREQVIKHISSL